MTAPGRILAAVRHVTQLHENGRLVAFAQTAPGRVAVCAVAAALLYPLAVPRVAILAVVLVTLMPARRRVILSLAAVGFAAAVLIGRNRAFAGGEAPQIAWLTVPVALAALGGVLWVCYRAARRFDRLPSLARRYPLVCLHLGLWAALGAAWATGRIAGPWRVPIVLVAGMLPFLVWRCGYMLLCAKRGRMAGTRLGDHLWYLLPAWGGTNVPYGKGLDYLGPREARSAEALAAVQLSGIKLLVLAILWRGVLHVLNAAVYGRPGCMLPGPFRTGSLGIPLLADLMNGGAGAALPTMWCSLYLDLIRLTLGIAIMGHGYIGALRLCGFAVFRNTYKPLLAPTLVDFWGRFYYYFKELLVEFFFYPTFVRCFRSRPRLRLFTAVFAAAMVGNMYYHALRGGELVAGDLAGIQTYLGSYWLHCLLLAAGVAVSMVRQEKARAAPPEAGTARARLRRIRGILFVWVYYSVINIWNVPSNELTFQERTTFFLSLFGLQNVPALF